MTSNIISLPRRRITTKSAPQTTRTKAPHTKAMGLLALFALWRYRRHARADLARLDDRMLADIGLTRAEADMEVAKPFWRG